MTPPLLAALLLLGGHLLQAATHRAGNAAGLLASPVHEGARQGDMHLSGVAGYMDARASDGPAGRFLAAHGDIIRHLLAL